mgnify:CR=1 FL=1
MAMQREQAARGAAAAAAAGSDGEEEEEGGSEQGGAAPAQRQAIYNVEVIHDKLEDISWSEEAAWEESLALTRAAPTAVANPENDLERELAFYNQVCLRLPIAIHTHCFTWRSAVRWHLSRSCTCQSAPPALPPCRPCRRLWMRRRRRLLASRPLAWRGSAPQTTTPKW